MLRLLIFIQFVVYIFANIMSFTYIPDSYQVDTIHCHHYLSLYRDSIVKTGASLPHHWYHFFSFIVNCLLYLLHVFMTFCICYILFCIILLAHLYKISILHIAAVCIIICCYELMFTLLALNYIVFNLNFCC